MCSLKLQVFSPGRIKIVRCGQWGLAGHPQEVVYEGRIIRLYEAGILSSWTSSGVALWTQASWRKELVE